MTTDPAQKKLLEAVKIAFTVFLMKSPYPDLFSIGTDSDGSLLLYAETGGTLTEAQIAEIESCTIHGHAIKVLFRDR